MAAPKAVFRRSDCALMLAMAAGEVEALGTLSARYSRALTAAAWRILGDQLDAQEVAADVLWQAWCDCKSFAPERGAVVGWLMRLARNRAIDRLRSRRVRERADGGAAANRVPDPAEELDQAERARIVRAALAGLDSQERIALELAYFSGLSHPRIAEQLGIPVGTVKTRIRVAMNKLRQALDRL
jgi:RNA polymerase sigma-70 factor (ECF subfamily)